MTSLLVRSSLVALSIPLFFVGACSSSSTPATSHGDASTQSKTDGSIVISSTLGAGTAYGSTFKALSAVASTGPIYSLTDAGPVATSGRGLEIFITNSSAITCSVIQSTPGNAKYSSIDGVQIELTNDSGAIKTGTSTLTFSSATAALFYFSSDATCTASGGRATAGEVTITAISSTSVSGWYWATFESPGMLTGSFDLPFCAAADAGTASGSGTCVKP